MIFVNMDNDDLLSNSRMHTFRRLLIVFRSANIRTGASSKSYTSPYISQEVSNSNVHVQISSLYLTKWHTNDD